MKYSTLLYMSFLLLLLSCNIDIPKTEKTAEKELIENKLDANGLNEELNSKRKSVNLEGSVAPLIQKHPFFEEVKDAKSGKQNDMKIVVTSAYEYKEQEGKEVLDGKAYVKMVGMGFGSKISADFKNGKLHGTAYKSFSAPGSYMLLLIFDNDILLEGSFYTQDFENCMHYGPLKDKSLKELDKELENILKNNEAYINKFKAADCPTEMKDIFQ
jgi:hypothetical protein